MPGLAVQDLTLSHFRSYRLARLSLDGRPVTLFGPNGAGKTNLLEAVSLLSPGRGLRRAPADELARRPEALGWKVAARVATPEGPREIELRAAPGESRSVRIDGKAAPQMALGRITRVLWLIPAMDRIWIEGAEGRRRFLDRIALSFFPGHGDASLAYEKAMRERNRLLRDQVSDTAWYGALEGQMARAGSELAANRRAALDRIGRAMAGAETAFPAADLALSGPDGDPGPETEEALAAALAGGRGRDMAAGRSLIGPHRIDLDARYASKGVPAAQSSTGEQKALLVSLVLANARALADELAVAPILLLDEVAAHLDADRRGALFDELVALDTQAWMTGTGAELFTYWGDRAQAFEVTEEGGETRIKEARPS